MPIGSFTFVPTIAHELETRRQRAVLDLGIGSGMYGAVVRQWGDWGARPWQTHLVGVEGWSDYRNPLWDLYDVVVETSIESFLEVQQARYDLILMLDVIEHFPLDIGRRLIPKIVGALQPDGRAYVGTPAIMVPQGAVYGNVLETHRSLWSCADFVALGGEVLRDGSPCPLGSQMILARFERP